MIQEATDKADSCYQVKNWAKFQHFKDRKPPWIKLYRDLLDDIEWHNLDAQSAKILVMLWLIASEDMGRLPDAKTLAFRLRLTAQQVTKAVTRLSHWLGQSDITAISQRYQNISATDIETPRRDRGRERDREETEIAFEDAWLSFGKYGVKKKALVYWQKLNETDRRAIVAAIPAYIKCVNAGRQKKQFEGWINPENRCWDMDWSQALKPLTPTTPAAANQSRKVAV